MNPSEDKYYFNRGNAYKELSQYLTAINDYTEAINLNPEDLYLTQRSTVYEKIGDKRKASLDKKRATTPNPKIKKWDWFIRVSYYNLLLIVLAKKNRFQKI